MLEFYRKRVQSFTSGADALQLRENKLSIARLISFISSLVVFFILLKFNVTVAWAVLVAGMSVFGVLIKIYVATEKEKVKDRYLADINQAELNCLEGDLSGFADGNAYVNMEHANSYDLDIFGHASVYQYINRTASRPAADLLAEWLTNSATPEEIRKRQQAVLELSPLIEWRHQLITLGYLNKNSNASPDALTSWAFGNDLFNNPRRTRFVTVALSALGITATIIVLMLGWPLSALILFFAVNFVYYFTNTKKINKIHEQVSRSAEMLETYSELINLIEKQSFNDEKLRSLQQVFLQGTSASERIRNLSRWVGRLDMRLNIMVSAPLNLFLFWDFHCCLSLEKWKRTNAGKLNEWFSAMAEFEVLANFSNMAFNNPGWVMPEIISGYFTLESREMGHPLIPSQRRVSNDIQISGTGKTIVITGSNMSGKSTFLRTCGVNAVIAFAGGPVCAEVFRISHVKVYTSMRIIDSLEDNTSSFYAELKRLASIIQAAEKDPNVFLLLDEILRGTNSNDRFTGSVALMKQLMEYGTVSVVATHDLRLAEIKKETPGKIDNYHFDVKVNGDELFFDYKLTTGICTSLNASILMKKMGIRM